MDIYKIITDRMIEQMEQGQIPWQQPWVSNSGAVSHSTGKPYSLLNQMLLGAAGEYITFKQVQAEGGRVRKGEKSHMVVFWKFMKAKDEETGEEKEIPILRYYNVFHIDQCEGITAKHMRRPPDGAKADQAAESIISTYCQKSGVKIHHEGGQAYYRPSTDSITLPPRENFFSTAEYYSTAFHEMVHSAGHMDRLARLTETVHFGSEAYSKENWSQRSVRQLWSII